MIEPMMHVHLTGLKSEIFDIIRSIRDSRVFHFLIPPGGGVSIADDRLEQIQHSLQDLETRISVVLANLPAPKLENGDEPAFYNLDPYESEEKSEAILKIIEPRLMELQLAIRRLEDHNRQIRKYKDILVDIHPLVREFHKNPQVESIVVILDRRSGMSFSVFEQRISTITEGVFQLVRRNLDKNFIAILALFDKEYLTDIQTFLYSERVSEMRLPSEFQGIPVRQVSERIQETQIRNDSHINGLHDERAELSEKYYNDLETLHRKITIILKEFDIINRLSYISEFSFEVEGFVPKSFLQSFIETIQLRFDNRVTISSSEASKDAPVLRRNKGIIKSFETLTDLVGLPVYGSIDPTPLVFILFPFFWGFMVGDVGYGLIILLLAFSLPKMFPEKFKSQSIRNLLNIFIISSIWTIGFGILYGELFGNIGEELFHWHPIWLNRYTQLLEFLVVAIIVGYLVILFGLTLGVLNNLKTGHSKHAKAEFFLLALWGSIFLVIILGTINLNIFSSLIGFEILFVLGFILYLIRLDGVAGIIHVIDRFSNILSFARLMAIGLVGAEMAYVANDLYDKFIPVFGQFGPNMEPVGLIVGLLITLSLHLINLLILILSPSIHALRLNVYEFFTQFTQVGEAIKYEPYGYN